MRRLTISPRLAAGVSIPALLGAALIAFAPPASARITEIDVNTATSQSPTYSGQAFGNTGTYRMINGTVKGEVDPNDPLNAVIVDIDRAPRNARGMVEYSTDFQLLIPTDLSKGNHRLVYDITNRGGPNALTIYNDGGAQTTSTPGNAGNGFLFREGYALLESGWDITVGQNDPNGAFGVTVPVAKNRDGSSITGPALEEFDIDTTTKNATSEPLTYAAATADKSQALLTVRANFGDTPIRMPSSAWDFTDSTLTAIKLNPPGTNFGNPNFFGPSGLYEFSYIAKDPLVAGLGFAAIRDLATFLRDAKTDDKGNPNPLASNVKYIFTTCSSQPCRTMHDYVLNGFNEAEHANGNGHDGDHDGNGNGNDGNGKDNNGNGNGRDGNHEQVFDGVLNWKAGGSGIYMMYRFSQPTRTHRQHIARWFPEFQFPFANQRLHDDVTGETAGRLDACEQSKTCPKTIEANSANEYWAKAGSVLTTDTRGRDLDLSQTPDIRYYLFSSFPHGAGPAKLTAGICRQLENPLTPDRLLRALLVDLDAWVSTGQQPPANRVPRRNDGTLVASTAENFPSIPGVTYNGIHHTGDLWDFGRQFDDGIISIMPPISRGTPYPVFVPQTDSDGNDVAGIRSPDIAVPIATYTGWGLRAQPANETDNIQLVDGCDANGQIILFATTLAARQASGDPRPSLAERYGTHANYVNLVTAAAQALEQQRLLLDEDVQRYITDAQAAAPSLP